MFGANGRSSMFSFSKNLPNCSPKCLYYSAFPAALYESFGSSASMLTLGPLNPKHSNVCNDIIVVLVYVALMTNYVEHLFFFLHLFSIHISSLVGCPKLLPFFLLGWLFFLTDF